jgi:hypothetical protein
MVWRYSITNPFTGGIAFYGTTRKRPTQSRRDPRRAPTDRQRAFVVARDRTCRGISCRVSARRAEIDHIEDHVDGGPTQVWNLDCKCTACHDLSARLGSDVEQKTTYVPDVAGRTDALIIVPPPSPSDTNPR